MKTRFFSFGCSFTNYHWPTWADIVGREFDYYENWGTPGAGNHYIFYTLMECINRNKLGPTDTVGIMWSSAHREDRYLRGEWYTCGSVYCGPYPAEYLKNWCDSNHYLLTTASLIDATRRILDSVGCRYWFYSMVPINLVDDDSRFRIPGLLPNFESAVMDLFADSLAQVQPSVYEVIFNSDWRSLDHVIIPKARKTSEDNLQDYYERHAQTGWPSFKDFFSDNLKNIMPDILKQMEEEHNLLTRRHNVQTQRTDTHPTPLEHAQFLEHNGFILKQSQRAFIDYWQERVLTKERFVWMSQPFKRF